MKTRILISVPGPKARGGITGYFYTIKKYQSRNIKYVIRGARRWPVKSAIIIEYLRLLYDVIILFLNVISPSVKIVQLNTSLGKSGIIRDLIFQRVAKAFRKKIIVFFHGWNPKFVDQINTGDFDFFYKYLDQIDVVMTLSNYSKNQLIEWGFRGEIFLMSTIVNDSDLEGYNELNVLSKFLVISDRIEFLFLARIEKTKGIYEAIDIFNIVKTKIPNSYLTIAGDGLELENIMKYVNDRKIEHITFKGFVEGDKKKELFQRSHILIFPSYTEGMPTSVLEAMAFGLVIVTRPVGGLIDFFNKKNGLMLDTYDPVIFAKNILTMLQNDISKIAVYNYNYAKDNFYASNVAKRNNTIYNKIVNI